MNHRIVVTAAYPFIPAELNMAHFASTYIPADAYNRFLKQLGMDSILVSATDVHGILMKSLLKEKGDVLEELITSYHQKYQKQFEMLSVELNNYPRTDTLETKNLIEESFYRLKESGYINRMNSENYICMNCGEYLPKHYRIVSRGLTETNKLNISQDDKDYECFFCKGKDIRLDNSQHWFLSLSNQECQRMIYNCICNQQNTYVKKILNSVFETGIKDWDFTRDSYFGVEIPERVDTSMQYFYIWYESLIAYLSLFKYSMGDCILFKHFMSKNIVYYHGVIWPVLLYGGVLGTNEFEIQISAKGFLNMSQSDEEIVNLEMALSKYPSDYLRFYAIYTARDSVADFCFKLDDFKGVINNILCKNVGGFFKRCRSIFYKFGVVKVPDIDFKDDEFEKMIERYIKEYKSVETNHLLLDAISYVKYCGGIIEKNKIYNQPSDLNIRILAQLMANSLFLMYKFIPTIIDSFNIFSGFKIMDRNSVYFVSGRIIEVKKDEWNKI